MDINNLRVYNAMYNLKLSEEDFEKIQTELDSKNSGVANMNYTKGYMIYIHHDNNNDIHIKKAKKGIPTPSRILCKTLITFQNIPEQIYTLHSIAKYKAWDWNHKFRADNLKQLKDRIIERFVDDYDKTIESEDQMKAVFWLFDQPFHQVKQVKARKGLLTILKVFSMKNKRLVIIKDHYTHHHGGGFNGGSWDEEVINYQVTTYKPNNPEYNYASPGREFKKTIWLDDDLIGKVSPAEISLIHNRKFGEYTGGEFLLLTSKEYGRLQASLRIELMSARRQEEKQEVEKQFENKAEKTFREKGKFVRNGITFSRNNISYGELEIQGPDMKNFIEDNNIITADNNDFNTLVASYIEHIMVRRCTENYYSGNVRFETTFEGEVDLKIGKVRVRVISKNCGKAKILYLSTPNSKIKYDYRIKRDEVCDVLKAAIGYSVQEDYDKFIERVSKVSLRLDNVLRQGLSFTITVRPREDNDLIKTVREVHYTLKVERDGNKNFLVFDDEKFKITDTPKFLTLQHTPEDTHDRVGHINRMSKILMTSVKDLRPECVGTLIREGGKEHEARVARSKEFITNAVKLTKAKKKGDGWIVKGVSGKQYWVGKDLQVYTFVNGEKDDYLCIVDVDSNTKDEAGRNDCIAKRLLALSKDEVVAKDIYNNGDKVDKYWKEVGSNASVES